jgi:phage portal protein BeeE
MRLSQRLINRKAFSEPPFWDQANGNLWGAPLPDREQIGNDFEAYIQHAYAANGVVFSCMAARMFLFSEARFAWQRFRDGQPQSLFTNADLQLLEQPWPGGTIGDLLGRLLQDADLAGNGYYTTADDEGRFGKASAKGTGRRIVRMRPDWTTIILGSKSGNLYALDTRPIAYLYRPPANLSGAGDDGSVLLLPDEVAHFSPIPDPAARFRGMSWLTPVIREIQADKAATKHKLKFFQQGATISTVVSLDKDVQPDEFDAFVARMRAQTEGVDMAYKTLYLGGGADVTLNGTSMQQMDFKVTQGAGETRIASASGMHPVIVGLSEGLEGSSLNAGNFDSAIRLTTDKTIRPLWRNAAGALARILPSPGSDSRLWYDARDVAFLQNSTTDQASIQSKQATTAKSLTDAGFTPESVVAFLDTGNLNSLQHSGLYSVQLQKPGATKAAAGPEALAALVAKAVLELNAGTTEPPQEG